MSAESKKILITGTAGFIGYHLADRLISEGFDVVGLDNINDYYDVNLKYDRLTEAGIGQKEMDSGGKQNGYSKLSKVESHKHTNYSFYKLDLSNREGVEELFKRENFDVIIHLAAQAGVRYSLDNPHAYLDSNITGFLNILEGCRHHPVEHLIFASSSSVYGANRKMPFKTSDNVDHPVSLYAATKKSNELMAHTYAHLFGIPVTGLRFFTVYGPWGRPDMAYFKFANLITSGKPIDVYNYGKMSRDFTYIDDIVESVVRLIPKVPAGETDDVAGEDSGRERSGAEGSGEEDSQNIFDTGQRHPASPVGRGMSAEDIEQQHQSSSGAMPSRVPYRLFNIGNNSPVDLMEFIREIEKNLGREAEKNLMEMQPGDVPSTWADVSDLFAHIDYRPRVDLSEGIYKFIKWYKSYYKIK